MLKPLSDSSGELQTAPARKGIQSIETGFRILEVLANATGPLPLKDIASATGMTPSAVSFYMVSLLRLGVALQDSRTSHYRLGPYAMRLGLASLAQYDLLAVAHDRLVELANLLGHSVFLGVWANHGPTIVYRADGQHSRSVFELRVGSVLPVLRSALGRLFLAYLPSEVTAQFVAQELQDERVGRGAHQAGDVPANALDLQALLAEVREHGMSRCRHGILSDYTAVSAPILDYSGTMIAAVTTMGRIGVLDDDWESPSALAVRRVARGLSQNA